MAKTSAGILLYRYNVERLEVLLVHMGGPFWARKDAGAWTIPKGEYEAGEAPLDAARREFEEETGFAVQGPFTPLTPVQQKGGKVVQAWAAQGEWDVSLLRSNTFSMEWPPKSGRQQTFPEVDKAAWFSLEAAREKILEAQIALLEEIERILK